MKPDRLEELALVPLRGNEKLVIKNQRRSKHKNQEIRSSEMAPRLFPESYEGFLVDYLNNFIPKTYFESLLVQKQSSFLYLLSRESFARGGIVDLLSKGEFQHFALNFIEKFVKAEQLLALNAEKLNQDTLAVICKRLLLEYELRLKGDQIQCAKNIRLDQLLNEAPFFTNLKQIISIDSRTLEFYDKQICVFRRGHEEIELDFDEINLEKVCHYYKNEVVDIRIQKPMDFGFNPTKLANFSHEMTVGDYREYQKAIEDGSGEISQKNKELLSENKIFFAVNFDPKDSKLVDDIYSKLEGTFLGWKQEFDLLSYLDQNVPGCTLPQLYFKVKGCWTGGHQQNINMCAVNINHGPDPSEWYAINVQHVQALRSSLKKNFHLDLYLNEGLWFEKISWFLERGFPIKRILQRKGDIVVSGPGTLHWVRSFGTALQSAWNIMPKTDLQVATSLARHAKNERLGFQKSSTIQLKSILVKYLNHEHDRMSLSSKNLIIDALWSWLKTEERQLQEVVIDNEEQKLLVLERKLSDLQSICQSCLQEVLVYFAETGNLPGIYCLKCIRIADKNESDIRFGSKYPLFYLKRLLTRAEGLGEGAGSVQLCSGEHIGKIPCNHIHNTDVILTNPEAETLLKTLQTDENYSKAEEIMRSIRAEKAEQRHGVASEEGIDIRKRAWEIQPFCPASMKQFITFQDSTPTLPIRKGATQTKTGILNEQKEEGQLSSDDKPSISIHESQKDKQFQANNSVFPLIKTAMPEIKEESNGSKCE